jgi:tripartite-type tricarboxylate transporter receptor subunit TctC
MIVGCLATSSAFAQSPAEFFANKTVRLLIGFETAGTYGQYALLASRHLRKHMAGNPTIVVQSMPGAGGIAVLNYAAKVAPRDGTSLIMPPINMVQDGLLNPKVEYDPAKFDWIGRMMELVQIGVASEKSGIRKLDDGRARAYSAAGVGVTNPTSLNWHIINKLLGTRYNVISGYRGLPDAQLAWTRGEADVVMMNWETAVQQYTKQIAAGEIRPLFSYTHGPLRNVEELPAAKGIPAIGSFGKNEVENALLRIFTSGPGIGRSLALYEGAPADRVAAWRKAFDEMLKDKEFLSDIQKAQMRFDPLNGQEIGDFVNASARVSGETLEGVKKLYNEIIKAGG